jgi:hypothetical protein
MRKDWPVNTRQNRGGTAALILWIVQDRNELASAVSRWAAVRWLGKISYGVLSASVAGTICDDADHQVTSRHVEPSTREKRSLADSDSSGRLVILALFREAAAGLCQNSQPESHPVMPHLPP